MGKGHKRKRKGQTNDSSPVKNDRENPFLKKYTSFMGKVSDNERKNFFSEEHVDSNRRAELWMEQADLGEACLQKFAWAIPDARAVRVLKNFSPVVEIGCGAAAYWCRQMHAAGVDVIGFDKTNFQTSLREEKTNRSLLSKGGPEVLSTSQCADRTLFLCYPDDEDEASDSDEAPISMAARCLKLYKGQYVIHVGETFRDANLSIDQAPWGRSSSPEFQERLAAEYHCVLQLGLPNWLHTRDSLSVWKRSEVTTIVFASEDPSEPDEEHNYRHVPAEERLPVDVAAPYMQHLLGQTARNPKASWLKAEQKHKKKDHRSSLPSSDGNRDDTADQPTGGKKQSYQTPW